MTTASIGDKFEQTGFKWAGCGVGNDGCLYAVPCSKSKYRRILKVNPSNDSTELVGPELKRGTGWYGCIGGPDGFIYGFPCKDSGYDILKFDPISQEVTMLQATPADYGSAVVGANNMIYFISEKGNILCLDPLNQSTSLVPNNIEIKEELGYMGAVMANDGYIYLIPGCSKRVIRFNPSDESTTFIGDEFHGDYKWYGGVLGPDGHVYGIPIAHNYIIKIDVSTQTTSLVGPDLGKEYSKYTSGVVGQDRCIYMGPCHSEFVLKFNPRTGITSTVGKNLGSGKFKYCKGMLATNGYIYTIPYYGAHQVLKIKSWDKWIYLKPRLLVEQRRARRKIIQFDDELNIVQYFIIHCNDDIFRTVLEMV